MEKKLGNEDRIKELEGKLPKEVKKRRKLIVEQMEDEQAGWEEYTDYLFPDDAETQKKLKILDFALRWKMQ